MTPRKPPAKRPAKKTPDRRTAPTTKKAAAAPRDLNKQVLKLRRTGLSLEAIAAKLGLPDVAAAHAALEVALEETLPPTADESRRLELERLDRKQTPLWAKAMSGDLAAIHQLALIAHDRLRHTSVIVEEADGPGPTETATAKEITVLGRGRTAPALCAAALVLAREVDEARSRGKEPGLVATAARELRMTMSQLRGLAVEIPPTVDTGPERDPADPVVVDAAVLENLRKKAGRA